MTRPIEGHVLTGDVQPGSAPPSTSPAVAIDLFAGAGGMSLGFEAAGFDVLVAVDNNPVHVATHEWNFPLTNSLCADVTKLSAEDLIAAAKHQWVKRNPTQSWSGDIDCVFGGPSCQGFSEIGRRNPEDERNTLLSGFARRVSELMPKYFVMENVPGLLSPVNRGLLSEALKIFTDAGYSLAADGPFLLNSGDFGVPQARRRVFILGSRADVRSVATPVGGLVDKVTVAEALDDLRFLEGYTNLREADSIRLPLAIAEQLDAEASSYVRLLRTGKDNGHGSYQLGYERQWNRAVVTSCGMTVHREDVVERFRRTAPGAEEVTSRLPRLRADGLAPTLRAGTGRDHGSFTSARPIHHRYPRVITVREAARLHSFPDWFRFHSTKWHGFQQIGNSVPPFLAEAIALSIMSALDISPNKNTWSSEPGNDALLRLSLVEAAQRYNIDPSTLPKESRVQKNKPKVKR